MTRPIVIDLYCCQGGAGMGWHRAGFDVVGVDIVPQPRYPFECIQQDALEFLNELLADGVPWPFERIDGFHASPPCQGRSKTQKIQANDHPALIGPTRELLEAIGLPYVIENTPTEGEDTDPLRDPVLLCGTMFGLPLYRHRLFEISGFEYTPPLHGQHYVRQVKMGRVPGPDEFHQPVGNFTDVDRARRDMEMPWASRDGLREAIPPAYTEHIGGALMASLSAEAAA